MWLGWDRLQEAPRGSASSCHVEALTDVNFKAPWTLKYENKSDEDAAEKRCEQRRSK